MSLGFILRRNRPSGASIISQGALLTRIAHVDSRNMQPVSVRQVPKPRLGCQLVDLVLLGVVSITDVGVATSYLSRKPLCIGRLVGMYRYLPTMYVPIDLYLLLT